MRVDRAPFNDVRVRQAFRLMMDRKQVIEEAYGGDARLGNDLYAIDDPLYDTSLPQREQDIEQAKSLLKQAGHENLTVNLVTAAISTGVVDQCVVFAQQAKAAGVTINIQKLDTTTFYNNQYIQRDVLGRLVVDDLVDPGHRATRCSRPLCTTRRTSTIRSSTSCSPRPSAPRTAGMQKQLAHEIQSALYNTGGYIIPCFPGQIDAYSKKVTGFVPDKSGFGLTWYRFRDAWFV